MIVNCLVGHLWNKREATLDRIKRKGWNWDKTEQEHQELELLDKTLTELGTFDGHIATA